MTRWWLPLVIALGVSGTGCTPKQTERTNQDAREVGQKTGQAVRQGAEEATQKASHALDNAAVTSKVKTAIGTLKGVDALDINVDTQSGVVTLSGTVPTPQAKASVLDTAKRVDGVKSVVDKLKVAPKKP